MDKQMFLDNIFDYTSGSTDWKYKGEKPAVIDFYRSLQSRYRQTKRIICCHGDTVTAHHHLYPQNGTAANHYRSGQ